MESQASVCIVGGNPVLLRAEPTKQKTRRPERSGITGAVSPKKMGKERKQNVRAQEACEEEGMTRRTVRGFEVCDRNPWKSLMTALGTVCSGYFRVADKPLSKAQDRS